MLADSPSLGFCVLVVCRQLYKSHCWLISLLIRQFCSSHGGKQGSGPDRGQSPVEWGDFPFVCPSVFPSTHPPLWTIQPGLKPGWLAVWASDLAGWAPGLAGWASALAGLASALAGWASGWLDGPEGGRDGRTKERKISPCYRTLSVIRAAAQKQGHIHNSISRMWVARGRDTSYT